MECMTAGHTHVWLLRHGLLSPGTRGYGIATGLGPRKTSTMLINELAETYGVPGTKTQ